MRSGKCHASGRSCTRVCPRRATRCSSCVTHCCARMGRCGRWSISRSRPNTAVVTVLCTVGSTRAGSVSRGCVGPWPGCRYRKRRTAGSCRRWTSRRGCARTPTRVLTGPFAIPSDGARGSTKGLCRAAPPLGRRTAAVLDHAGPPACEGLRTARPALRNPDGLAAITLMTRRLTRDHQEPEPASHHPTGAETSSRLTYRSVRTSSHRRRHLHHRQPRPAVPPIVSRQVKSRLNQGMPNLREQVGRRG